MPKSITSPMRDHLDQTVTTLASMWRVDRVDGTRYFLTDHDADISFEGNLYKASTGFNRTAIANNATLGVDNLDVDSILSSLDITEIDLRAGKFDFAEVRIFLVNWDSLSDGKITMRRGWLGEVIMTELNFFKAEIRGMTQVLSQKIGELYQVECRVDLTSAKCGIPILPPLSQRSTAYVIDDNQGPADFVRVNTAGIPDPIFLTLGTNLGLDSLTGWTTNEGTPDIQATSPVPNEGTGYVGATASATYEIEQTINIDTDLNTTKIDAGDYTMDFSVFYTDDIFRPFDTGQIIVNFLTAADAFISKALDSGTLTPLTPAGTWNEVGTGLDPTVVLGIPIPATARKIQIILRGDGDASCDFYWDDISIHFNDPDFLALEGHEIYENRVYECTIAGVTAANLVVYDTTIGNNTADGTATFQARDAFMRDAIIDNVIDQENFTIIVSDARAVDDWFNGGAVFWMEKPLAGGNNAGLAMEMRD